MKLKRLAARLEKSWRRPIQHQLTVTSEGLHESRMCLSGIHYAVFGASKRCKQPSESKGACLSSLLMRLCGTIWEPTIFKGKKQNSMIEQLLELAKPVTDHIDFLARDERFSILTKKGEEFKDLDDDGLQLAKELSSLIASFASHHWNQGHQNGENGQAGDVKSAASVTPLEVDSKMNADKATAKSQSAKRPAPTENGSSSHDQPPAKKAKGTTNVVEKEDPDVLLLSSDEDDNDECEYLGEQPAVASSLSDCVIIGEMSPVTSNEPPRRILPAENTSEPAPKKQKPTATVAPGRSAARATATPTLLNGLKPDYEATLLGVTATPQAATSVLIIRGYREKHREAFEVFNELIWTHYRNNSQNDEVYNWKMGVRQELLTIARRVLGQRVEIYAVGSTVNGCGSYNSDMDVCLVVYSERGEIVESRPKAMKVLHKMVFHMQQEMRRRHLIKSCELIHAKVPIIKLETLPPFELEVDLNCNNIAGVYNSHLIHYYARLDDRFPALCLLVKHWAIKAGINDAMTGTFNSYSLILLMLHFLQCGVKPAVLPNLQYLYERKFSNQPALHELSLFVDLEPPLPMRPLNEQTVGELLIGFFDYYAGFDFKRYAISVRKGRVYERSSLPSEASKFELFIEEPFDGCNTARCVTRKEKMALIQYAFREAKTAFEGAKEPRLENIRVAV